MLTTLYITTTSNKPHAKLSHLIFNKSAGGYTEKTDNPILYIANLMNVTMRSIIINDISADRTEIHLEIYDDYRE